MQNFSQFFALRIMHKKICKNPQMCLLLEKITLIFFNIFCLVKLKKTKNENYKIHHYSFKMADNDLKIWQNHLLPNSFHMVGAKLELVLRPISHWNPTMPFLVIFRVPQYNLWVSSCPFFKEQLTYVEGIQRSFR